MIRRAFFFLLDGARADVFDELLARGELPNVSRYVVEPGSYGAATTVFPSVTGVAYIPFLTGCFPGRAEIPGLRWLDRERYGSRWLSLSRFRDYCGLGSYLIDRDLSKATRTLFEQLRPSSNIFSGISRGTGVMRNGAYLRRIPYMQWFFWTQDSAPIDRGGLALLMRAARRPQERFTFHTTLSVDEHSHTDGPRAARVLDSYRRFDAVVGQLARELAAQGALDESLLMLSADHGHSEVRGHFDLERFFVDRGLRTLYYPRQLRRWLDADAACMVGGNAMAHVYLRGAHGWRVRPGGDDLLGDHHGLLDDLLAAEAIDHVAWRASVGGPIRIASQRGRAQVTIDGDRIGYRLDVAGRDPFGYGPLPAETSRSELLRATAASDYPDAPLQLAQIFDSRRTGDLVISARPGWDLRHPRHERWDHRSCHGSLHREHMRVPLASSAPLRGGPWRTADVYPTVLELLEAPLPLGALDGLSLVARPVEEELPLVAAAVG